MAEHLGVNPRWASGFQGFGQIPGTVELAVNAVASGAADYVVMHRALHNPIGRYHGNLAGQAFVIFVLVIAAAEASLALGLVVLLFRQRQTLDADAWRDLKG